LNVAQQSCRVRLLALIVIQEFAAEQEQGMSIVEQEVEFQSQGITCRGLFVKPSGDGPAPLIVLAHGLGGLYEMRFDAYARRFARAGYAALTFDYRYFGRSDGSPRHLLERDEQQRDIAAAIAFGKTLEGVDAARVVLWGTSLAGGHVIDVASGRNDLAAAVVQCPFTDGFASARASSLASMFGISFFVVADWLKRLTGLGRVLVPLAAPPLLPGLMTKPDVIRGVLDLVPPGTRLSGRLSSLFRTFAQRSVTLPEHVSPSDLLETSPEAGFLGSLVFPSGTALINGVTANFAVDILSWRPGPRLRKVRAPILVCACEGDSVAPAKQTIAYAKAAPSCELKVYPYGHFDIYMGEPFEVVVKDQLEFLARVVPTRPAAAADKAAQLASERLP
jgi:pimeloyl-ACP methyl ester carboxylesterase